MSLQQSDAVDDFLEHYGVKGMKWGVRRKTSSISKLKEGDRVKLKDGSRGTMREVKPGGTPPPNSRPLKKSDKPKKLKGPELLSDAELRQRINRLQMEKQYKDLTAADKSRGKKVVEYIGKEALGIGRDLARESVKTAVKSQLETKYGISFGKEKKQPKKKETPED